MALTIQMIKYRNQLIDEEIVVPRLVNTQTMEYTDWCAELADGSTLTAADVSAVMKQIENKLPTFLGFNAKVICSPEGLTFRPKVSGSIKQSELKAKLEARKAAETDPEKAARIDVNRMLTTSDLSISDCSVSIVVDLPKEWIEVFQQKARLKRVKTTTAEEEEEDASDDSNDDGGNSGGTTGGSETPAPAGGGTGDNGD